MLTSIAANAEAIRLKNWYLGAAWQLGGVSFENGVSLNPYDLIKIVEGTADPASADGDASDLTLDDTVSLGSIGYGHTDYVEDLDIGKLVVNSSDYYNLTWTGGNGASAYIYDATADKVLTYTSAGYSNGSNSSFMTGIYIDSTHINYVYFRGYSSGESYNVNLTEGISPHTFDGDAADLTLDDTVAVGVIGSGHTDSVGDKDSGVLDVASGYYNFSSSGNTTVSVYDATVGAYLTAPGGSSNSGVYVDARHTNYVQVTGSTVGEAYEVSVTKDSRPRFKDGDETDLTESDVDVLWPEYSGRSTGYGHTDFVGDTDAARLIFGNSGYFDLSSTGNTNAYVYDATAGTRLTGSGGDEINVYLDASHRNYLYVEGFTPGESYSVSIAKNTGFHDGDATDLTESDVDVLWPEYSHLSTGYGHTDFVGDTDAARLIFGNSGYFDLRSTGNTNAYVYDATAGTRLTGSGGDEINVYLDASHRNYLYVEGFTPGESYSVSIGKNTGFHDGDETDLTESDVDVLWPEYSHLSTGYGHTDFVGDTDAARLIFGNSGYFDLSSTGNTNAYVYDATAGTRLTGSGGDEINVYLDASHRNYLYVEGFTPGESYSVSIAKNTGFHDGDETDLTESDVDVLWPEYSHLSTGYGHTDFVGDTDAARLIFGNSGYFDLRSTGNTNAYVYDATAGTRLTGSGGDETNIYLDASHRNYLYVEGFTPGESYSVSIKPHG